MAQQQTGEAAQRRGEGDAAWAGAQRGMALTSTGTPVGLPMGPMGLTGQQRDSLLLGQQQGMAQGRGPWSAPSGDLGTSTAGSIGEGLSMPSPWAAGRQSTGTNPEALRTGLPANQPAVWPTASSQQLTAAAAGSSAAPGIGSDTGGKLPKELRPPPMPNLSNFLNPNNVYYNQPLANMYKNLSKQEKDELWMVDILMRQTGAMGDSTLAAMAASPAVAALKEAVAAAAATIAATPASGSSNPTPNPEPSSMTDTTVPAVPSGPSMSGPSASGPSTSGPSSSGPSGSGPSAISTSASSAMAPGSSSSRQPVTRRLSTSSSGGLQTSTSMQAGALPSTEEAGRAQPEASPGSTTSEVPLTVENLQTWAGVMLQLSGMLPEFSQASVLNLVSNVLASMQHVGITAPSGSTAHTSGGMQPPSSHASVSTPGSQLRTLLHTSSAPPRSASNFPPSAALINLQRGHSETTWPQGYTMQAAATALPPGYPTAASAGVQLLRGRAAYPGVPVTTTMMVSPAMQQQVGVPLQQSPPGTYVTLPSSVQLIRPQPGIGNTTTTYTYMLPPEHNTAAGAVVQQQVQQQQPPAQQQQQQQQVAADLVPSMQLLNMQQGSDQFSGAPLSWS